MSTTNDISLEEVEMPIKRTDGDTLEERLTDNAYQNILPARYLRQDDEGNIIEDQEDLFERVAKNVSLTEVVYKADKYDATPTAKPHQVHQNNNKRHKLVEEVFETSATLDEDGELVVDDEDKEVELTEKNINKFSYDTVVPEIESDELQAAVDDVREEFQNLMERLGFTPNSPTLMNAGDHLQQLSACFVMSPDDDISDIHDTAKEAAEVFQSGGGTGYGFWKVRPYGDTVSGTGGIASGPITFMRTYDQLCETIAQGGTRRGAQMGVMRVTHPDVIQFIHAKNKVVSLAHALRLNDPDDYTHNNFMDALDEARELIDEDGKVPKHLRNAVEGHLSNFNISVGITDEFMEKKKNGEDFTFINPRTEEPHIASAETKELYARFGLGQYVEVGEPLEIPAEEIWERIIQGAHENGEPGVIYLERANKKHSFDVDKHPEYEMLATNPCVAEGTLVNTPDGYRPVEEIETGDEISTVIGSEPVEEVETHENYEVYEVNFSDGGSMKVTAQHKFHVLDGKGVKEVPLHQLEAGDTVRKHPTEMEAEGTSEQYDTQLKRGLLVGDGSYTESQVEQHNRVKFATNASEDEYNENIRNLFNSVSNEEHNEGDSMAMYMQGGQEMVTELDLTPAKSPEKTVDVTEFETKAEVIGFLDGLLASDGNVNLWASQPQVRWDTSSEQLAEDVQNLLNLLGMNGSVSKIEDPQRGGEINGRKVSANHPKFTVTISGASAGKFADMSDVDSVHPEKGEALFELRRNYMTTGDLWKAEITSIESVDEQVTVYDLYCEESDTWITKGYVQQGCGEQPLMEYEACNLGHINLSTLVAEDSTDWRIWRDENLDDYDSIESAVDAYMRENIDMDEFEDRISTGTRFLENVVTMSDFPVDKITETVRDNRKIGLGIMGLAQMYIQMGVKYGEEVSTEMARWTMMHINHESKTASHELAEERGVFGNWEDSKYANPTEYAEWFEHHTGEDPEEWEDGYKIRNHNTTTIAPTGTTSMVGNTSGGCEPIYNVAYYKNVSEDVQGDDMLVEFDDYFLRTLEENDIDVDAVKNEAEEQMAANEFDGIEGLSTVPDALAEVFVTTGDLRAKQHATIQTACQDGVDSAISKTVNAPNESTVEDAKEAFEYIYDNGGKGVTYYRDGTRSKQVLTTRADNSEFSEMDEEEVAKTVGEKAENDEELRQRLIDELDIDTDYRETQPRPDQLNGITQRMETGYGKVYVTVNADEDGRPLELFANIGHSGGYTNSFTESLAKTISIALRSGVDPDEIVDELKGTRSPKIAWDNGDQIHSIPDAIGTALDRAVNNDEIGEQRQLDEVTEAAQAAAESAPTPQEEAGSQTEDDNSQSLIEAGEAPECPECGSMELYYSEGCKTCESCGWSEC